ncbi:MAG: response regulator, partial [Desulfobacterales bacterium]|nr:response regulator [Desulfobacterales bacterium]
MNKVLIVDDLELLLKKVEKGLAEFKENFEVLTASNGKEAMELLRKTPISLLATDTNMPDVDGLELLAFMTREFPGVPCIVMTSYGAPEIIENLDDLEVLSIIEKPFLMQDLGRAISDGLERVRTGGPMPGVPVGDFLRLIETEQKTCLLEISLSNTKKGHYYFQNGVLFDSLCGASQGEKAALKMLGWENVKIVFKKPS